MTHLRFRRQADDHQDATGHLQAIRPADWDATTITFTAAGVGVMESAVIYGNDYDATGWEPDPASAYPPPAPIIVEAVRLRALPPAPGSAPRQLLPPVKTTEPAVIGDALKLPVIWCEIPRCIGWFHDPASAGFADARARAAAAGWRTDTLGRLACPRCQQSRPEYRTPRPLAWHHPEVRRRWHSGQRPGEDTTDMLAVEAELGRRISRETPALARDIAAATNRHGRTAGTP